MKAMPPRYHFRRIAGEAPPPEAWRMLDATVARWVLAHGGSPLLAQLAGWASYAEGRGDSALLLTAEEVGRHGMRMLSTDEVAALQAQPMVAMVASSIETSMKRAVSRPGWASAAATAKAAVIPPTVSAMGYPTRKGALSGSPVTLITPDMPWMIWS